MSGILNEILGGKQSRRFAWVFLLIMAILFLVPTLYNIFLWEVSGLPLLRWIFGIVFIVLFLDMKGKKI